MVSIGIEPYELNDGEKEYTNYLSSEGYKKYKERNPDATDPSLRCFIQGRQTLINEARRIIVSRGIEFY